MIRRPLGRSLDLLTVAALLALTLPVLEAFLVWIPWALLSAVLNAEDL
jgi:hypothetical protein